MTEQSPRSDVTSRLQIALDWFATRGWTPFDYQQEVWRRSISGESGLVHAPTGFGKTLAAWMGPLLSAPCPGRNRSSSRRRSAPPLTVLWITPMRALAADLRQNLATVANELAPEWRVEARTGDTSSSDRARQKRRLPTALITTPESLSLLLSYPDAAERFASLQSIVVDEWHELLGTKRGTQTELALARLRALAPGASTWGLSATMGNLQTGLEALLGPGHQGTLVAGALDREIEWKTVLPPSMDRFPWAGHLGLRLLDQVAAELDQAQSSIVFVNTRSQAELWYQALRYARYQHQGRIALHHGSLDRVQRLETERAIAAGELWATVATSSLDLGVDFAPVDQVVQVGSPKGIARLAQRAGRSGHGPGRVSRLIGVPTHALELVEFSAARDALTRNEIEPRRPLAAPLDVLAQHIVTAACGGGVAPEALFDEVRSTYAYRHLSRPEWEWCLEFCRGGGPALQHYERYSKVIDDGGSLQVRSPGHARDHRQSIGTIASFGALQVVLRNGRSLGSIEELFLGRLNPGEVFTFAGRSVELVRLESGKAVVKPARSARGIVPRWMGGRLPFSTQLAGAVRRTLGAHSSGAEPTVEMRALAPLLDVQRSRSTIPDGDQLLIERVRSRDGDHAFVYPIEGYLAHEGLAAVLSHRIAQRAPLTLSTSVNDWGFELVTRGDLPVADEEWRDLLSVDNLLDDVLACLDTTGLARRHFREVARVAGLVHSGPPHRRKNQRQLQTSASLVFDVLSNHDADNLLLAQTHREVLERTLDVTRLEAMLAGLNRRDIVVTHPKKLTPFAFPLWANRTRERLSSETWEARVRAMAESLERGIAKTKAADA